MVHAFRRFTTGFLIAPALFATPAADYAAACNKLGLDLFRTIAQSAPNTNLVLSPYSIESALTLAYAGSEEPTRNEMGRVLSLSTDENTVHTGFLAIQTALQETVTYSETYAERNSQSGVKIEPLQWRSANRLFGQEGYPFRESFFTLMRDRYATPFEVARFRDAPEAERNKINHWVEEQTAQKIRDLIPAGDVNENTRLMLVNACYLKARWDIPFTESETTPLPFHGPNGEERVVPFLHATRYVNYEHNRKLTVISLDYISGELCFLILLPDKNTNLRSVVENLDATDLIRWSKNFGADHTPRISLSLPKFQVKGTSVDLASGLIALGMRSAFDGTRGTANFDRIAPRQSNDALSLSGVIHQTFISVDENGTEAAAATAIATTGAGFDERSPIEVRVDRPFIFAVQHRATGACLFLGRVTDPAAGAAH